MTTARITAPARTLRAAYEAASAVVAGLGDEESWLPTGCTGWAVRDLVFHCLQDASGDSWPCTRHRASPSTGTR
ncbi:maleylpyruvate isomerase N-terminal domain-containing protein [Streptomyces sp. NPDC005890]|uniref:maleylpyruvate isomerase N-terminal domain-containing protein n=1 Tax=Streptomyces sp. NPDC005890 TaxID=3154568 RepID=UPI003409666F